MYVIGWLFSAGKDWLMQKNCIYYSCYAFEDETAGKVGVSPASLDFHIQLQADACFTHDKVTRMYQKFQSA